MARAREERRRASAKRRVETHDTGGGSNYLRLPDNASRLQVKPGKYRFDFMSYVVTKGKGQQGGNPYFEKGELAFERTFFVHRGVGPNEDWHLCAAKTFGQPCPICEHRANLARDPNVDEEILKELAPKERQLWIVKDLSEPDELYVWEYSYHLFGRQLDAKIRSGDEEDGYEYFADPIDGLTVRVNFEQSDRGKWVEATDIEFRPRREKYDADVVDEMPDLDSMLVATPYDKLKKLFLQTDEDVDDEPQKKPAKSKDTEDIATADEMGLSEGDRVYYSGGVCEIMRISKDGTSLTLEDADGDVIKAVGCDEVQKQEDKRAKKASKPVDEDEDEDEEEPAPKRKPKPSSKKKPEPEPEPEEEDEDDDWDDEEDEDEEEEPEPPPKKKAPAKKVKPAAKKPVKQGKADEDADDWDDWDD